MLPAPQLCFWGGSPSCPTGCVSRETPQRAPSTGEFPSWIPPRLQYPPHPHSWGGGGLQDPTLWRLCQAPFSSRICPPLGPRRNLGGPGAPSHIPGGVCVCMCALGGTAMGRPVSRPSPCGLNLPCLLPGSPTPRLSPRWDKDSLGHSSRGRTPPAGQPRTLVLVPGWPGFKSRHGLPSCVT